MAQPLHIPILYTGEQVAVPDWKGLGKNIRESYRRASENRKEKQRYEQVRNDRMAREILSELDVADVNFTNEQVQAIQTQLYGGLEQGLTNLIKDKKGESRKDLGVADYAQAKSLTTKYNQEISKYKISEQIRNDDIKIMLQKPDLYTKEAIQKAQRWDYNKDGVYKADNLGKSLRVFSVDELAEKDKREAKDADYVATQVAFKNGVEETKKIDLEKQFYTVEGGVPTLKEDAAVEYMVGQYALPSKQQDLMSVMNNFDKLPDVEEQKWIDKYGEEEAPVAWYTLTNKDKIFPVAYNVKTEPVDETKGSGTDKKTTIDLISGTGNFGDKPIKLTGRISNAVTLDGQPIDILGGLNDVKGTNMSYRENPATKKKEWMVQGQMSKKGGSGMQLEFDDAGKIKGMSQGGSEEIVEFLFPYNDVKEPMGRHYDFKNMSTVEKQNSTTKITPEEWNTKWGSLKKGQTMVGLDGVTYTKK